LIDNTQVQLLYIILLNKNIVKFEKHIKFLYKYIKKYDELDKGKKREVIFRNQLNRFYDTMSRNISYMELKKNTIKPNQFMDKQKQVNMIDEEIENLNKKLSIISELI